MADVIQSHRFHPRNNAMLFGTLGINDAPRARGASEGDMWIAFDLVILWNPSSPAGVIR